jgi:uncharacterized protein with GYD domain
VPPLRAPRPRVVDHSGANRRGTPGNEGPTPRVRLFDWTDQGVKIAAASEERVESSSEMAQSKHGVTLERIYWTVGAHDLVAVLGAPAAPAVESVSAFLLDLTAAGNVRSTTMRAFDRDEMAAIIGRTV